MLGDEPQREYPKKSLKYPTGKGKTQFIQPVIRTAK